MTPEMTHARPVPMVSIRHRQSGDINVVELHGEIDVSNLEAVVRAIADSKVPQPLVLDLSGLTFLDASSLRALLAIRADMRRRRRELAVVCPRGTAAFRLFTLTGTIGRLPAYQTQPEAIAQIAAGTDQQSVA